MEQEDTRHDGRAPARRRANVRRAALGVLVVVAVAATGCSRHGNHRGGDGWDRGDRGRSGWTAPTTTTTAPGGDQGAGTGTGTGRGRGTGGNQVAPGGAGGGGATTVAPSAAGQGGWWKPTPGTPWQIQLSTPVDLSVDAPVYDIDGELNSRAVVDALHAKGRKVICYFDAGAAENYRADVATLPGSVLGATVDGWPNERWLDIRQIETLRPLMTARMDMCKAKGFDAVDPDMVEAYAADSGFPITYADQLRYNRFLAQLAHERGLAIGLKGNVDQVKDLVGDFDFTVNEECAAYDECDAVAAFARAGKAVFHIEYDLATSQFCPTTKALGFSSLRKRLSLDAWSQTC